MSGPPLWTIKDPKVRAIVGANRQHEEQQAETSDGSLDRWLGSRKTDGRSAGYTKCIHRQAGKRCQRRARYFGKWAGGGLCYEDAGVVRDDLHAEDRERFDQETERRSSLRE